ncbi:MAG: endo-1,4-beta-xylanase [Planctomycetaceae bacterium]
MRFRSEPADASVDGTNLMGVMRFLVLPDEAAQQWPEASSAYITGLDGRVFISRVELLGKVLKCTRASSESGKLHVSWPVPDVGRLVLTTTSLPESDQPYLLPLELARGKIGELRDQSFQWQSAGMMIPSDYHEPMAQAFQLFSRASIQKGAPEAAARLAQQALKLACQAGEVLAKSYTHQRRLSRKASSIHPPALLGCTLDESIVDKPLRHAFFSTFSAAAVPIEWSRVEPVEGSYQWEPFDKLVDACQRRRCVVRAGPLIDFSPGGLPVWLAPWAADFLNLQSFVCDFMETAVSRYAGRFRMWEVSARGNFGGGLSLTEEQRLAVTARSIEAAQRTDTEAQLFIRVSQPWGEYQAAGGHRLTPFQFVDALIRSRIGLTGVNLELAVGYHPGGDLNRDLLSVSRLIDLWSLLGVQLHATLAFASSALPDPQASPNVRSAQRSPWRDDWSEPAQAAWAEAYVSMLMAKPQITGVFWTHFHDGQPHRFSNAGVVCADGTIKPLLHALAEQQQRRPLVEGDPSDSNPMDSDGTWVENG